jgi:hypothetical protein
LLGRHRKKKEKKRNSKFATKGLSSAVRKVLKSISGAIAY